LHHSLNSKSYRGPRLRVLGGLMLAMLIPAGASAQGYQVQVDIGAGPAASTQGPVRMARISYYSGYLAWRPNESFLWEGPQVNLPVREGAGFFTQDEGRAELQFDDGSAMRFGGNASVKLDSMYSDGDGEFTEITLGRGVASLHLLNSVSEYQLDTPNASIKAFGPADFRVGVSSTTEVCVRSGQVDIISPQGSTYVQAGNIAQLDAFGGPPNILPCPDPDEWDAFCSQRTALFAQQSAYLPSSINLVAGGLDSYGSWSNDPQYGNVWAPNVGGGWRPYSQGRWVWVSPFGWTWVDNQPWGWAPSHYGAWFARGGRWFWRPGPARQYWSPAVVSFAQDGNGSFGWCPLAPEEVSYPATISVGFGHGNWEALFSIGSAACYVPGSGGVCQPRPWHNTYVNRNVNVYNITNVTNTYVTNNYEQNTFVPKNAAHGGASFAGQDGFASSRSFQSRPAATDFFRSGKTVQSASPSGPEAFGPKQIAPTFRPSPTRAASTVKVFHAPLPSGVQQHKTAVKTGVEPSGKGITGAAAPLGSPTVPQGPYVPHGGAMVTPASLPKTVTFVKARPTTTAHPVVSAYHVTPPVVHKHTAQQKKTKPTTTTTPSK